MTLPGRSREWRGRLVPYVARWSGEVVDVPYGLDGAGIRYADETLGDRDSLGVLWQRELTNRDGEPDFGEMHTGRQRRCMRGPVCQVCGEPIVEPSTPWLIPASEWSVGPLTYPEHLRGRRFTWTPPTCSDCVPVALRQCPALRQPDVGWIHVEATDWHVAGVYGEQAWLGRVDGAPTVMREPRGTVIFDDPETDRMRPLTLAKGSIVELVDWAVIEEGP